VPTSTDHTDDEPDYTTAIDNLSRQYEGVFTRDEVSSAIDVSRSKLEPDARIQDFLGLLVERRASEALRARAKGGAASV